MKIATLLGTLLIAACGGSAAPMTVEVRDSAAAYAKAADFDARMDRVLTMSAEHWHYTGGYEGLQIVFQSEQMMCDGSLHLGCYLDHHITVATDQSNCVERSPFPHEILHFILEQETGNSDPDHTDPRWSDLNDNFYPSLAPGTKLLCATP